jgi:hypothetical protein
VEAADATVEAGDATVEAGDTTVEAADATVEAADATGVVGSTRPASASDPTGVRASSTNETASDRRLVSGAGADTCTRAAGAETSDSIRRARPRRLSNPIVSSTPTLTTRSVPSSVRRTSRDMGLRCEG